MLHNSPYSIIVTNIFSLRLVNMKRFQFSFVNVVYIEFGFYSNFEEKKGICKITFSVNHIKNIQTRVSFHSKFHFFWTSVWHCGTFWKIQTVYKKLFFSLACFLLQNLDEKYSDRRPCEQHKITFLFAFHLKRTLFTFKKLYRMTTWLRRHEIFFTYTNTWIRL